MITNRYLDYLYIRLLTVGLLTMLFGGAAMSEEDANPSVYISNLITGGDVDLSLRYRYEYVDQDGIVDQAKASTVRSRLSLQSGTFQNFDLFFEMDDVREIGADDFNAGAGNTPNRTQYPVVADPEGTEVNQAYLDYNVSKSWSWR
ncbi:MAG: hypothetical protein O7G86_07295, partial [Gammaproteobacteria bacterium]|nr:hypothetical protein [Gammaproteobacteria bacterium]